MRSHTISLTPNLINWIFSPSLLLDCNRCVGGEMADAMRTHELITKIENNKAPTQYRKTEYNFRYFRCVCVDNEELNCWLPMLRRNGDVLLTRENSTNWQWWWRRRRCDAMSKLFICYLSHVHDPIQDLIRFDSNSGGRQCHFCLNSIWTPVSVALNNSWIKSDAKRSSTEVDDAIISYREFMFGIRMNGKTKCCPRMR